MESGGGTADKHWWGPRIWRILHSLAEVSDREGCGPAWRCLLKATVEVLPCEVCRRHFAASAATISLPVLGECRTRIRHGLWVAHAAVSTASFAEEQLTEEYGSQGNRDAVLDDVVKILNEVSRAFRTEAVLGRFRAGALPDWERAVRALVVLLRIPPMTPKRTTRRRY